MMRPIRVLAVDDSAVMRGVLRSLFQQNAEKPRGGLAAMELCGVVEDGMECLAAVLRLHPDVVVLDLEMPRMHGLDVLERLRVEEPGLPVIMCSSHTERGARATLDALALGAADYVMKPAQQRDFAAAMETLSSQLLPKIAALAGAGHGMLTSVRGETTRTVEAARTPCQCSGGATAAGAGSEVEIVVIGVSTGGPSALETMLPNLEANFPVPVLIVQHMPKLFTGALAERLDRCCALRVREAHEGAALRPGTIWLAPGDSHMEVAEGSGAESAGAESAGAESAGAESAGAESARGRGRGAVVRLHQRPSFNHCRPSVDFLFNSAAHMYCSGVLAVVMTGMGSDGLAGSRCVHESGGAVLTQDQATSAVWGMPGRVFGAGLSREPLPVGELAAEITRRVWAGRRGRAPAPARPQPQPQPLAIREVTHGLL